MPARTANIAFPAIGETRRRARAPARRDFTPADEPAEPLESAHLPKQAEPTADTDERRWPQPPDFLRERSNAPQSTEEKLRQELSARGIQIADLHNIQQQQAAALMVARTAIESLEASTTALQEKVAQRDNDVTAAQQELQACVQEKDALGEKLEDTERELADVLQKLLHLTSALNDKELALISAEERAAALAQELADKSALDEAVQNETAPEPVPAPAAEDEQQRLRDALAEQSIQFESQLKRLEGMLAAGDEKLDMLSAANARLSERSDALDESHARFEDRIKTLEGALAARERQIDKLKETNVKLSDRCDALTNNNVILESGCKHAQEKLKSQTSDIKLLETALCAGHETAEQKIAELTGELQREREEHAAAVRASATIRGEIALLLSKLTTTTPSMQ